MKQIPFKEIAVKDYLDSAIKIWRQRREESIKGSVTGKVPNGEEEALIASCYVDAYQSVRVSIFGELLP